MAAIENFIDQIITGDCIQVLSSLPESSIDVIFADPPYNLQLQQELWRPNLTRVDAVDEEWDHFDGFSQYDDFTLQWLSACRRVLKDSGTIWVIGSYHNIYRVGRILQDLDFWILNDLVWVKTNPMPNFRGVRFTNAQETLIWAQKVRGQHYTFNHQAMKAMNGDLQMRSDWHLPLCTGKERLKINGSKAHATQKPEALLYRVLLSSTDPGDVVLDPFFGTGTTGAVARRLHRRWIGIERDSKYVQVARERIEAIEPGAFDESVYRHKGPRNQPRLPFGALIELGLLQPGEYMFFDGRAEIAAVILSNGHIRWRDVTGSIHQVGKVIQNGPCNGWERWYHADENGELVVINALRELARQKMGLG